MLRDLKQLHHRLGALLRTGTLQYPPTLRGLHCSTEPAVFGEWLISHILEAAEQAGIQRSASDCLTNPAERRRVALTRQPCPVGFRGLPERYQHASQAGRRSPIGTQVITK